MNIFLSATKIHGSHIYAKKEKEQKDRDKSYRNNNLILDKKIETRKKI